MPRRTYVGSHAEVVLPDGTTCKKGSAVDIPAEIDVKELDASGNWASGSPAKPDEKE